MADADRQWPILPEWGDSRGLDERFLGGRATESGAGAGKKAPSRAAPPNPEPGLWPGRARLLGRTF